MKSNRLIGSTKGFGMIDILVSTVILVVVVTTVSVIVQRNIFAMTWNQQTKKAAILADMVVQKYQYLASVQFDTLNTVNQTQTTPAAFFSSPDNMGFDGMTITTLVDAPSTDGSKRLSVNVQWGSAASQRYSVTKYLSSGVGQMAGAPVYVHVLDANGNGIPGFETHADHHYNPAYVNSQGTNEVIAYTDASGLAVLNNVSVAPNLQQMKIAIKKTGSPSDVRRSDPNFSQGYYASPSVPGAPSWSMKWITVSQTSANTVYFKVSDGDIRPLASISGKLHNLSGGSVANVEMALSGWGSDGNWITQHAEGPQNAPIWDWGWDIQTDAGGNYEWNNIAPTDDGYVHVPGTEGSDPHTPPTDAHFVQGYAGSSGSGWDGPWDYPFTMADPPISITNNDVDVKTLGSLRLKTVAVGGAALPGATVVFDWPELPYGDRPKPNDSEPSDANGFVTLYNLFGKPNENVAFKASFPPNACVSNGQYIYGQNIACSFGQSNQVTLTLNSGAYVTGTLRDASNNLLDGMRVSAPTLDGNQMTVPTVMGAFTICGIAPLWPLTLTISDPSNNHNVAATFSGTVFDSFFRHTPVPGQQIIPANNLIGTPYLHDVHTLVPATCQSDPAPTNAVSDNIISDSTGKYGPICAHFPFQITQNVTPTGGPIAYNAGMVTVSFNSINGGLMTNNTDGYYQSVTPHNLTVASGGTNTGFNLYPLFYRYAVSGTLVDGASGVPLQGVNFDPCQNDNCNTTCPTSTDSHGNFGPVQDCWSGRTSSFPGTVAVSVPAGVVAPNTGAAYQAAIQTATLPNPATPATPLVFTFSLNKNGGGM